MKHFEKTIGKVLPISHVAIVGFMSWEIGGLWYMDIYDIELLIGVLIKSTGTKFQGRKELEKILDKVYAGDTIIFDSVSRMSRDAEEGF